MSRVVTAAIFFLNLVGALLVLGPFVTMMHMAFGVLELDVFQTLMVPALAMIGTAFVVMACLTVRLFAGEN